VFKFPKTPRLSAVLRGDLGAWRNLVVVIEEKVDGANAAISFESSNLVLQSRGHVLSGGPREAQFDLFKQWAAQHRDDLFKALGDRYVAFGEWCYAKHRMFYDALPSWFLGFDLWDKDRDLFLSTPRRRNLLADSPITQIHVIHEDVLRKINNFGQYIGVSPYKTSRWKERFDLVMASPIGRHYDQAETDQTQLMEGIYVRIEDDEQIVGRMKLHREGFDKIHMDDDKWLRRPIFPNQLGVSHATNR
jgi:hypothetical protein